MNRCHVFFLVLSVSVGFSTARGEGIHLFSELARAVESGADVPESGEFTYASESIGETYGVAGWKVSGEFLILSIYDDFANNWRNQDRDTRNFLVVQPDELLVLLLGNLQSSDMRAIDLLKDSAVSLGEISGFVCFEKSFVSLLDFEKGKKVLAKRNLSPISEGQEHK